MAHPPSDEWTETAAATRPPPRSVIANAGWNAFATFWTIAISFALTKLLILRLGTDHYGILLLVWSVTGLLGIMNLGLGEATLRFVARYHGDRDTAGVNRVFGSTLVFFLALCAVVSAVLFAAAPLAASWFRIPPGEHALLTSLLRLTALLFTCGVIGRAFGAIPMALQRYDVSAKINIAQNVVRGAGYLVLVVAGYGILQLVLWDLVAQLATLVVQVGVARRMLPGLRPLRHASLAGLREVFGYSVFSFLTYVFHAMYRESGKLALGAAAGTTPVAYFGTPDSVAYRVYMVVANGGETLLSRFSVERDPRAAQSLVLGATWASLAVSVVLFVPLAVMMPALLSLWISPEFAARGGTAGQMVALGYLGPAAFAPLATFLRGTGRPWVVTVVMAAAGLVTFAACVALIPRYGVAGAGSAYLLSAIPWLAGLGFAWAYAFGAGSLTAVARAALVPLVLAAAAFPLQVAIRERLGEPTWLTLLALGGSFAGFTALFVFGVDLALGGDDPPSRKLIQRVADNDKVHAIVRRLPAWRPR